MIDLWIIPVRYDPLYWGAVFPLGMYTVCSVRLSQAIAAPYLAKVAAMFVYVPLTAWCLAAYGLVAQLQRARVEQS